MTQQQLAQAVGIRFQQVQKYESGANRVSASRLWDLAKALNAPVTFFFDGLDQSSVDGAAKSFSAAIEDKDTHDMMRAYLGLEQAPRRRLLDLALAMHEMSGTSGARPE